MSKKIEAITGLVFGILIVALSLITDAGLPVIVLGSLFALTFLIYTIIEFVKK